MSDVKEKPTLPIVVVVLKDLTKNTSYPPGYLKKVAEEVGDRIIRCGGQS